MEALSLQGWYISWMLWCACTLSLYCSEDTMEKLWLCLSSLYPTVFSTPISSIRSVSSRVVLLHEKFIFGKPAIEGGSVRILDKALVRSWTLYQVVSSFPCILSASCILPFQLLEGERFTTSYIICFIHIYIVYINIYTLYMYILFVICIIQPVVLLASTYCYYFFV